MKWSTPEVKQLNKERIRKVVQKLGKCTKSVVAKETGLSVATCNTLLNEMLADSELIKCDHDETVLGRPANNFKYDKDYHHVLGIIIAKNTQKEISYCVGNSIGEIIEDGAITVDTIEFSALEKIIDDTIEKDPKIKGISIGIPGISSNGVITICDFEEMVGMDLEAPFIKKYGIAVEVRNDMDFISCGLYNEVFEGHGNMVTMFFPVGEDEYVGSSIVVNGKLVRGYTRFSGEISYITEGFGISRKETKIRSSNRDFFIEYAAKMVLVMITTIDPEEIVLLGMEITKEEVNLIKKMCADIVTEAHIPKIVVNHEVGENYKKGLIRAAINRLDFPLSNPL